MILPTIICTALLVVGTAAQERTKMDDKQMKMMAGNPHHSMMMTYRRNAANFAIVLRDMTKDGKFENLDLVRSAFSEIKRNVDGARRIRSEHMSGMDASMREKMKPMMEKMQSNSAAISSTMQALGSALASGSPDAREIGKLAQELASQLEMQPADGMKMKMDMKQATDQ